MTTATSNIADLKNPPAPREHRLPAITPGFGDLASFELMQRIAKMFSNSPLVPEIYKGPEGLPSCVIALNMAMRMQADPLMVMQNLYVVHGRPAWSAQFLIACFNQCGRFSAIRYRWQGKVGENDWGCRAWATEIKGGQEIVGPLVTMETAKVEGWVKRTGSKWQTIPELMLTYRAASWFVRTHAPEIAMGLPSEDEVYDRQPIDVTPERVLTPNGIAGGEHIQGEQTTPTMRANLAEEALAKAGVSVKPLPDSGLEPAPRRDVFSFASIAKAINEATTPDLVSDHESVIDDGIADPKQRAELHDLAKARRLELA